MNKKIIIITSVVSILVIVGLVKAYQRKQYDVIAPKKGDVVESIYGLGKVKSDETFEVKIGLASIANKVFVREGDQVNSGDNLISFEGLAVFKAPFSGTITSIECQEGEICLPQFPILRLENLNKMYIEVSLEQDAALRVRPGQETHIVFESQSEKKLKGLVKKIYSKNGDFLTHVEVEKFDSNILPGMTADVVINVGKKQNVLLIPSKAVGAGKVIRERNNKREKIAVEIGNSDGTWVELLSGDISLEDHIVIKR